MAIGKDWTADAAKEIAENLTETPGPTRIWIRAVIMKYCPFKKETLYEEVTRCTTCNRLRVTLCPYCDGENFKWQD